MNVFLMRHGDALPATENPQRPLSPHGRRRVEEVARRAVERGVRVSAIYHSGILRAKETAELVAEYVSAVRGMAPLAGLMPEDDPAILKPELEVAADSILLVGHLPFMSRLAGLLVNNDPEQPVVEFSPASIVCCTRSAPRWKFDWQIAP
jgi:phosphohistidine phosphatase